MSKHTPGEWRVILDKFQNPVICAVVGNKKVRIAKVSRNRDEFEANAAILSSAPELLKALKRCKEEYWNSRMQGTGNIKAMSIGEFDRFVDPVIAKAEGVRK